MKVNIISPKRQKNARSIYVQKKCGTLEWITVGYVILARLLFYTCYTMPQIEASTNSFLVFTWRNFLQGQRMPLYPLIIQLNRMLFHEGYLMGVVYCQIVVSMISVLYLYRTAKSATRNRAIACATAFFYGGNPWIMHFDAQILSESFAISISVFLLYHTVCYIKSHSLQSGMWMIFFVFLAVIEKAALFIYVPCFLIFMAIQFFYTPQNRKMILKLSSALLGIAFLLLLYAGQVWRNAATFSIDNRVPLHVLVACLETDLYQNYSDQELVKKIEKIWLENDKSFQWDEALGSIAYLFGGSVKDRNARMGEFNSYCIRSDPDVYIKYLMRRFKGNANKKYTLTQSDLDETSATFRTIYNLLLLFSLDMNIGRIYLIGGAAFLLLIIKWKINKECPWYYLGTTGMIIVIIVSVMLGTYSSYARCTSYVLPFAYFGMALLLEDFCVWMSRYRE